MRFILVAASVAVVTGFSVGTAGTQTGAPTTVTVGVDLRCTVNGASYSIYPWSVTLRQDDSVDWRLYPTATTDEMIVQPRNPKAWPFATTRSKGDRTNRPYGRDMRPDEHGNRYEYDILMVCKGDVSRPDTVRIDPEMIIQ